MTHEITGGQARFHLEAIRLDAAEFTADGGNTNMGLKDWLAKNVAGPSGYGQVMGREGVKNGLALGRVLYLGHGTRRTPYEASVIEDVDQMAAEGFRVYCSDPRHKPPMEDSSSLSVHTRAAGIAFAAQLAVTAAENHFSRQENFRQFCRSLGSGTRAELDELRSVVTSELVLHYLDLPVAIGSTVLNLENPGTEDRLAVFLGEVSKQVGYAVAFQRGGVLGFNFIAVPLAREIVVKVREAGQRFAW
jgi:hypothetical protein